MKTLQTPKLPEPQVLFIASLSDGQTIIEGKGAYTWVDGQPSPWNRLIRYTVDNKLTITSVSLYTPTGATFTMPPIGNKAKFAGYSNRPPADIPLDFEVKRHLIRDMKVGVTTEKAEIEGVKVVEFYTIVEAIYPSYSVELWVNEQNPRHSWVVVKGGKNGS